jgi:hypothetical protein
MQPPLHIPFHNFPRFEQLAPGIEAQFIEAIAAEGLQEKRLSAGKHHRLRRVCA